MNIYVLECQGFFKIGYAENVKRRVQELQIGNPFRLRLVHTWPSQNAPVEEKALHRLLENCGVRGEWFRIPEPMKAKLMKKRDLKILLSAVYDL